MRIQLDNHLHLEEESGNWYLSSTESGKVAWKASISQLVCAWKRYCSLDHTAPASDVPALQAELERYRKLATHEGGGWMVTYEVKNGLYSRARLSALAEAMEDRNKYYATRDRIQELEGELASWKTGQHCAIQHVKKEYYESGLNDMADLRRRYAELEQELLSLEFCDLPVEGLVERYHAMQAELTELQKERDEAANHLHSGRERLEKIAAQAATIAAQKSELNAYEERLRVSNGRVYLRNGVGETLDGVLEQRRLLKDELAKLKAKTAHCEFPSWASVGTVNDEFWVYYKGLQCCAVTPDGVVKSTGKALWRSAHNHSYRDVESALNAFEKVAANAKETEALLKDVSILRTDALTVKHRDQTVQWCADGLKVWAHDATWHDAAGNPHQVASLASDVETLKRELALARPTWQQWVERIKASPGLKVMIAEGDDTAVWACLGATDRKSVV